MDSLNMIQYLENQNDVDLLCPYCDEIIELFNNNLDFSINLHSQNVPHKEAYKKFQECKATEILDEKTITKQRELETLNKILQNMAMGTMSISFPNVDQNILAYSTLKSTLNLEEPSEALKKLFINFREGYKYNIHFIVQEETKLSCKLCSRYISITNDEIQQIHFLKTHLEGNHHKTNIENLLKSLPKNDFGDKYYFKLIPGNIFCKLCNVMTPISMSGLESTCGDLQLHLIDREHKRGEVKYLEEYKSVRQIFNYEVPELVNENRFYLIKVGESFKCSLCNMFIIKDETEVSENVLRHLNSIGHGKKYAIRQAIIENPIMDFISLSSDVEVLKEKIKPFKSKVIDHNLMFVSRFGQSNFKCNLCNIELFSSTVKIWPDHFNGLFHTQNKAILLSKQRLITFKGNDSNLSRCITIGKYFYRPKNGVTILNETKQSLKCDKTSVHTKIPHMDFTLPKTSSSQNFTGPTYNSDRLRVLLEKYADPVFFNTHKDFLFDKCDNVLCALCNVPLFISNDPKVFQIHNIMEHLKGKLHLENFEKYKNNFEILKHVLFPLQIPEIVLQNKDFLIKKGNYFVCTLCEKCMLIALKPESTVLQLTQHLKSKSHEILFNKSAGTKMSREYLGINDVAQQDKNTALLQSGSVEKLGVLCTKVSDDSYKTIEINTNNKSTALELTKHLKSLSHQILFDKSLNAENFQEYLKLNGIDHQKEKMPLLKSGSVEKLGANVSEVSYESNKIETNIKNIACDKSIFFPLSYVKISKKSVKGDKSLKYDKTDDNVNKKTSFRDHILHSKSRSQYFTTNSENSDRLKLILQMYTNKEFCSENIEHFKCEDNKYVCLICNASLTALSDDLVIVNSIKQHVKSQSHCKHKAIYRSELEQSSKSENLSKTNDEHFANSFEVLKQALWNYKIPQIMIQNKRFITIQCKHFYCTLCTKFMSSTSNNAESIKLHLLKHFKSKSHKILFDKSACTNSNEYIKINVEEQDDKNTPLVQCYIEVTDNKRLPFSNANNLVKFFKIEKNIKSKILLLLLFILLLTILLVNILIISQNG